MALAEAMWEAEEKVRLVLEENGAWRELDRAQIEAILADLDQPFDIAGVDGGAERQLKDETGTVAGSIRVNKATIALRRLDRPSLSGIFVEDASLGLGEDPERQPLVRYLDAEDMFTVLFSDLALAYIDGSLFRDEALIGGGHAFMRHLQDEPALAAATSEKGDFAAGQTQFTTGSVFRVVVDTVASEDILLCDDLGDEWADFIGVASGAKPATISFYHAKHGSPLAERIRIPRRGGAGNQEPRTAEPVRGHDAGEARQLGSLVQERQRHHLHRQAHSRRDPRGGRGQGGQCCRRPGRATPRDHRELVAQPCGRPGGFRRGSGRRGAEAELRPALLAAHRLLFGVRRDRLGRLRRVSALNSGIATAARRR